jgi:CO dehydrogenase nickel-insertion accessory protein CooC1
MKKIYLAINEQGFPSIQPMLTKKIPDSKICCLTSKEDTLEILKSSFHMVIVPLEYIDLNYLKLTPIKGTVILLDSSIGDTVEVSGNIHIYKDLDSFQLDFLTKTLENPILKEKKTNLPAKNEEHQSKKESDIHYSPSEDIEYKQCQKKEMINSTNTANDGKSTLSEMEDANFSKPIDFDPFPPEIKIKVDSSLKAKTDKAILANYTYSKSGNKVIGVWSPLPASGVTTFIVNFALFLSEHKSPIAVLEPLSDNVNLKEILTQYTSVPKGWKSFLEYSQQNDVDDNAMKWFYHGIDWIPIGDYEIARNWKVEELCKYMHEHIRLTKNNQVVLIDLKPGKMSPYTLQALQHLDEFWIVVDQRQKNIRHRTYIDELIEKHDLNVKLIVNQCYSSAKTKFIVKKMGFPLLAEIPQMLEVQQNEWESKPLIKRENIRELLLPAFEAIETHLNIPDKLKPNFWTFIKRFVTHG